MAVSSQTGGVLSNCGSGERAGCSLAQRCPLPLAEPGCAADALQPPLRCVATREQEGRTPSTLARARRKVPGNRTLRHPGAPTQTCCGVIQGAKLWGQRSTSEKPHLASDLGRMQRMNMCEGPLDGS